MKRLIAPVLALLCCVLPNDPAMRALRDAAASDADSGFPGQGRAFVSQDMATASITIKPVGPARENFGMHWDSVRTFRLTGPLDRSMRVYIEGRPANAAPYKPHYRDFVLQGLAAWSRALDNRLRYTLVASAEGADVTVRWRRKFQEPYIAGITSYRVGHADIEIRTAGVPDGDIRVNILHELGHALGIAGHSYHADDIMIGERRWRRGAGNAEPPMLSARDVQAIRRLYSTQWQRGEDLYAPLAQRPPVDGTLVRTAGGL